MFVGQFVDHEGSLCVCVCVCECVCVYIDSERRLACTCCVLCLSLYIDRMCSLSIECVLYRWNVLSIDRMCSLSIVCSAGFRQLVVFLVCVTWFSSTDYHT